MSKLTIGGIKEKKGRLNPSCYVRNGIMVDCGSGMERHGKNTETIPMDFSTLGSDPNVEAVLLTHSHFDHMASVPLLRSNNIIKSSARLLASPQTAEVSQASWEDTTERDDSPYTPVDRMITPAFETIPAMKEFEVAGTRVFAIPNGHLPGSCSYIFRDKSGIYSMIMGDWCNFGQPLVGGMVPVNQWPVLPDQLDGTDQTYASSGFETRASIVGEAERMGREVMKAVQNGTFVRIFVFAVGKMQNVALRLQPYFKEAGIPLYVDSRLGRKAWEIYRNNRWSENDNPIPAFGPESGIFEVEGRQHREDLINSVEPNVIITSPGMADFGLAIPYLKGGLERADHMFASSSWLAEGSTMYRLREIAKTGWDSESQAWKISDEQREIAIYDRDNDEHLKLTIRAKIGHFGNSSHSTFSDFVSLLGQIVECRGGSKDRLARLRRIVLSHGSPEALTEAKRLLKEFNFVNHEDDLVIAHPGLTI